MGVKKRVMLAFLCGLLLTFTGCERNRQSETISKTEMLMDTVVTVTLWDCEDESVLEDCMEYCRELEVQFDNDSRDGEIALINDHPGQVVPVSDTTRQLLEISKTYETISENKFSIEIGALTGLWDFHQDTQYVPKEDEIKEALVTVDPDALSFTEDGVFLAEGGTKLDLGAVAKGYSADLMKQFLVERGVKSGIIDLGGNVLVIGEKPDHTPFTVGIQKPFADTGTAAVGIKTTDSSVVTSGVYQRYFERDKKRYHHLLDPDTGYPAETDLYSVTVLSENSVDGDALSTICMLLGLEKGKELIEGTDGVEAVFITEKQEIIYTDGIRDDMLVRT